MPTPTAYFEGGFVPLPEAKIGVMTHAFNYGTAVFEGVRGNWNEEHGELYLNPGTDSPELVSRFSRFRSVLRSEACW